MYSEERLRLKTFVKCIKEDGIKKFSQYILRNYENGIVYHKKGFNGDYDIPDSEEEILHLLRTGETLQPHEEAITEREQIAIRPKHPA